MSTGQKEERARSGTATLLRLAEDGFYALVAVSLMVAGALLFANVIYTFVVGIGAGALSQRILEFLDGLLLVFIVTELIHTVRGVIATGVLMTERFLIVGIVAAIRRLIVISAEAKEMVGTAEFSDAMLEVAILTAAVLLLGVTIFLLRRTPKSDPNAGGADAA